MKRWRARRSLRVVINGVSQWLKPGDPIPPNSGLDIKFATNNGDIEIDELIEVKVKTDVETKPRRKAKPKKKTSTQLKIDVPPTDAAEPTPEEPSKSDDLDVRNTYSD